MGCLEDLEPDERKFCEEKNVGKCFSLDDDADERPIGGKQAKEQRKKKKKGQPCIIDLEDELVSFLDAQKTTNEGRKEMLETQRHVSSENVEARKPAHLAAKEHKKSVMLEAYRALLMKETTSMPEDVRSEHVLAAVEQLQLTEFSSLNQRVFSPPHLLLQPAAKTMSDSSSYSNDSDELAPTKIIEEQLAEQSVLDFFVRRLAMKMKAALAAGVPQRQYGPRKSIRRDHEEPCYDVVIVAGVGSSCMCHGAGSQLAVGWLINHALNGFAADVLRSGQLPWSVGPQVAVGVGVGFS
ncbi:hypothetical protein C2845_PM06G02150 [Panicum miliaceum]|uniref:Uncharacterized protein n=1 Tax=Panicum miliaceum TaxID=4540 RepID=A0A3L6R945_PANMI|nr:hypothetical protein C2845_PM06G02150 [Panicum miliaceum]